MTDLEYIQGLVAKGRAAQEQVQFISQEQTDAMVKAVGKAVYDHREELSVEAVEETRMGTVETKIAKHVTVTTHNWHYLKGKKSVGIIDEDPVNGIVTIAKPMGVLACVAPSTNPTTTPVFNTMIGMKGRNSVIISPHPRSKDTTAHCVKLMRDAISALGMPADLIQVVEEPSIERSRLLMENCDATVATGGAGMVKAAYSTGKPCFGVGQGNVQCIFDEEYKDIEKAVTGTIQNRIGDNGLPCTGEQTLFLPRSRKDEILAEFRKQGGYILEDEGVIAQMSECFFDANGINRDIVGKQPKEALAAVGIDIPECRILLVELKKHAADEPLCREIMFPILRYFVYDDFDAAVQMARENLLNEGAGHSSVIYSTNRDHILQAGLMLPVGRVMVEQPALAASGQSYTNGLNPTMSIGCGTWGGNSISENLTYYHLLNLTKVSYPLKDAKRLTPEEVWAE